MKPAPTNPVTLSRARDALSGAATRARLVSASVNESVVEPLARLVGLASTLTPKPPPLWPVGTPRIQFTTHSATQTAEIARQRLGFDDINPRYTLPLTLPTRMNILVFSVDQPQIESACGLIEGVPLLVVSNDLGFQQLTACARELGHLLAIASRKMTSNEAHITPRSTWVASRRPGPPEQFAATLAIELLVPTAGLGRALRRVRELLKVKNRALGDVEMLYLARIFGVNFSDVARKCERARLLPLGGANAIGEFLQKRFGGAEKRAHDLGLPDRPKVEFPLAPLSFLAALEKQITSSSLSTKLAAELLGVSERALVVALAADPNSSKRLWQ